MDLGFKCVKSRKGLETCFEGNNLLRWKKKQHGCMIWCYKSWTFPILSFYYSWNWKFIEFLQNLMINNSFLSFIACNLVGVYFSIPFVPISWVFSRKLLLVVVFVAYVKAKVIKFRWLLSALTMYICMWLMAWSFCIKHSIFFPTSCPNFALDYPPIANWWHWSNQWTPSTFYFPSLWF